MSFKKLILAIPTGLPSALILAADLYLSLTSEPLPSSMPSFDGIDKIYHVLFYFVLTLVFTYDYAKLKFPHHTKLNIELLIVASSMLLGLLLESLQLVMNEGRCFEYYDIAANCAGVIIAFGTQRLWLMHLMRKLLARRHIAGRRNHNKNS